ncbi:unnamed protein product [Paramecium octaurelia]|uniref:Uncharacterized protein n=1 Tax=Paramecium octaurelia TaxID=43137 RepID=A0A8S1TUW9_PAROT|nr:unnamed protein product [Paramecium octaurelia]
MEEDNQFNEDFIRVQGLYRRAWQLRHAQKIRIRQLMDMYKAQLLIICPKVYGFQCKLQSLLPNPTDNKKLLKKIAKYQWVQIYFYDLKFQSFIHQDYCTYLIYNKIPIPNGRYENQFQTDIFNFFQDKVCQFIIQINAGFYESLILQDINSQYYCEEQVDNFDYNNLVEYLSYNLDDILSEEQEYMIEHHMREVVSEIIKIEYLAVVDFIQQNYSDLITNTEIKLSQQYPDSFCYSNFGHGFYELNSRKNKKNKIQRIQECQDVSKLNFGIYYTQVKKTIIILEIAAKYKIAYIINYFDHYRKQSSIFEKIEDFKIYKINTIKLNVEEAYELIKYLKYKNRSCKQLWKETIQFYKQQDFDEFTQFLEMKEQNYYQTLDDITRFISTISPQSNNYQEIYSQALVSKIQQNQSYNLDLIPIIEFDYDLKKLVKSQIQNAAILEDQQKLTIGVVIYLDQTQTILFVKDANNLVMPNDSSLEFSEKETILITNPNVHGEEFQDFYFQIKKTKMDKKNIIIFDVNTKAIQSSVAQFYVTLILQKTENGQLRNIQKFLELKTTAWTNILKILG